MNHTVESLMALADECVAAAAREGFMPGGFATARETLESALREALAQEARLVDVLRAERDHARANVDNAVKLLTGIHSLLYPSPIKTEDGRTMVFRPKDPDPHAVLQELSDRIRALPDRLAALAQPAGEPVAWVNPSYFDAPGKYGYSVSPIQVAPGQIPLYTHPPAPLTLTDEQIDAVPFEFNLTFGEADGQDEEEMLMALRKHARAVLAAAKG